MSERGLFITVEGAEGVGKSTNMAFLKNFLSDNGVDIVVTREPGGTRLGEDVRELLLQDRSEPVDPMAELMLLFAARAQHIRELIEPALGAGKLVLCDRFTDATYAYQCGGRGIDAETVKCLEELVQDQLRPDYTLLLDAPVSVGMARAHGRGELDRFERETLDFFERVRASYLALASKSGSRFRVINAALSLEEVKQDVRVFGDEILSSWRARQAGQ